MPCWNTSQTCSGGGARGDVPARLYSLLADARAQILVGIIESLEELGEARIAVRQDSILDPVEGTPIDTTRADSGLQPIRRRRAGQKSEALSPPPTQYHTA